MSCGKNQGSLPINITETSNKCDKTCNFEFNYGISNLILTNKNTYLHFSYNSKTSNITYNGEQYNVQDIRLYKPSINQYNGENKDAELFVHHTNSNGQNLLVCIPIEGNNKESLSSNLFSSILNFAPTNVNENKSINVNNYTLNNIIPKGSFYSYKGSLPYDNCNGNYNIIMFDPKYSANIKNELLTKLSKIIKPTKNSIKNIDNDKLQYNVDGTKSKLGSSGGNVDDIYIDCGDVDDNGEYNNYNTNTSNNQTTTSKISKDQLKILYSLGGVAGGLILMYILYKSGKKLLNKLSDE
jgi:carbonic anhydrase